MTSSRTSASSLVSVHGIIRDHDGLRELIDDLNSIIMFTPIVHLSMTLDIVVPVKDVVDDVGARVIDGLPFVDSWDLVSGLTLYTGDQSASAASLKSS